MKAFFAQKPLNIVWLVWSNLGQGFLLNPQICTTATAADYLGCLKREKKILLAYYNSHTWDGRLHIWPPPIAFTSEQSARLTDDYSLPTRLTSPESVNYLSMSRYVPQLSQNTELSKIRKMSTKSAYTKNMVYGETPLIAFIKWRANEIFDIIDVSQTGGSYRQQHLCALSQMFTLRRNRDKNNLFFLYGVKC